MDKEKQTILIIAGIILIGILMSSYLLTFSIRGDSSLPYSSSTTFQGLNISSKSDTLYGEETINKCYKSGMTLVNCSTVSDSDLRFTATDYHTNNLAGLGTNIYSQRSHVASEPVNTWEGYGTKGIKTIVYTIPFINTNVLDRLEIRLERSGEKTGSCIGLSGVPQDITFTNNLYLESDSNTTLLFTDNSNSKSWIIMVYKNINYFVLDINGVHNPIPIPDGNYAIVLETISSGAGSGMVCTLQKSNVFKVTFLNVTNLPNTEGKVTYFRFKNNSCSPVEIYPSDKTSNDYLNETNCLGRIENEFNTTYYRFINHSCLTVFILPSNRLSNDYVSNTTCKSLIKGSSSNASSSNASSSNTTLTCVQDTTKCSDGSYVSRDPNNNCNFKACPKKETNYLIYVIIAAAIIGGYYFYKKKR